MLRRLLFWVPTAVLAWVYAGYPAAAALKGRLRPLRVESSVAPPRVLTVGLSVYNEAREIRPRVDDILAQDVPMELEVIIASDGSIDGTEEVARQLMAEDPRVRLLALPRSGQTAAQNRLVADARGDIVVLTDAETRYAPGCLAALTAPFSDPRIGCTVGTLRWANEHETATAQQEGLYWRYEQLVRRLESRAGWLSIVTGALMAVRRDRYLPVPEWASHDAMVPLSIRDQGLQVIAVPEAVAWDRGVAGLRQQFRNRARTATRGIQANLHMARRLTPWRAPGAALAIWSHKILRWGTPWLAGLSGTGAVLLVLHGRRAYLLPVAGGSGVIALAGVGYVLRRFDRHPRWAAFPLSVVVVNAAFMVGWVNVLRRRRLMSWHRTEWQAR